MSISRRTFLETLTALAGGLIIGPHLPSGDGAVVEPAVPEVPVTPETPLGYITIDGEQFRLLDWSVIMPEPEIIETSNKADDAWDEWMKYLLPCSWEMDVTVHGGAGHLIHREAPVPITLHPHAPGPRGGVYEGAGCIMECCVEWSYDAGPLAEGTSALLIQGSGALTHYLPA